MVPAILDGSRTDTLPGSPCHHHSLQNIGLVNIPLFSFVLLNSAKAKLASVVRLEGADNTSIEGLDMGGETGLKVDKSNTFGLVFDFVTSKVVQCKSDFTVLELQFKIPLLNPPKEQVSE
jgi:hypothetical protein